MAQSARNPLRLRLALLLALIVSSGPALAAPWFARVWQADDGLPGDSVSGLAQTAEGYLWIATQSGLARFDGVNLQTVPVSAGRTRPIIRAMLLDRSGHLWLAQERGALVSFSPERSSRLTATNGLSTAQPIELAQSGDGALWIAYADGALCRVLGDKVTRLGEESGLPVAGVCSLATDAQGELWVAKGGQVGQFVAGKFLSRFVPGERNLHLLGARGGGIWIAAGDSLLKCGGAGEPKRLGRFIANAPLVRPTALLEDLAGAVWIGTAAHGLFRFDGQEFAAVQTSHGRVHCLLEDREGNIWVGTDGGGLNRLRPQVVELHGREAGLPFDTVRSVCSDARGDAWAVMQNGAVARLSGGEWHTVSSETNWPGGQATAVVCDTNGVVWIGSYSRGLFRWENGGFSLVRRSDGLASSSIRSLLADRRGNVWIAFSTGDVLQCLRDGQFKNYPLPAGSRAIRAMAEDAAGNIWLANLDARLLRVDGDAVVDETPRSAGPYRPIRSLAATGDGSLWIGYSTIGLGRLKQGQFVRLGTEQGLPDDAICSITPDAAGRVWFGSEHGIFGINEKELSDVADGRAPRLNAVSLGRDDGLPSLQASYGYAPGSALARDGRVLIATHSGLAVVHPERLQGSRVPPTVVIEAVAVDALTYSNERLAKPMVLPPGHRRMEVVFSAPSFIEPDKTRFRYRLEGWDEDWIEAGNARRAVYSRLPAGEYQFSVRACNSAGVWNEAGSSFRLKVTPFLWQTWWFRGVLGMLFVAGIFAVARYVSLRRLQTKVRRLEQENALQRERARIAKDIHDDLGAHMTQISLLSELTERALPQPEKAGELVRQIASMSRRGIKALDEIVWAVNPRNDTLPDLLDYAGQYAVDFLRSASLRCRVDFPDAPPAREIPADVRHGLFLAVKEALNNVVKHARASEVWLRVRVTETALIWVIEDDGCGFQHAPQDALSDGLLNMQQRLAEMGGRCTRESPPGGGTRMIFEVPWKRGT